jgi:hypothetical protein
MAESSKDAKARAEAHFRAVSKKQAAADGRNDERLAAEQVRDDKSARLKAQRLARDEGDRAAAEATLKAAAEAPRKKRS